MSFVDVGVLPSFLFMSRSSTVKVDRHYLNIILQNYNVQLFLLQIPLALVQMTCPTKIAKQIGNLMS